MDELYVYLDVKDERFLSQLTWYPVGKGNVHVSVKGNTLVDIDLGHKKRGYNTARIHRHMKKLSDSNTVLVTYRGIHTQALLTHTHTHTKV